MPVPDPLNPPLSSYPSPLTGYEGLAPLPDDKAADGKSFVNPPAEKSKAYSEFIDPLDKDRRGGFDVHIYYYHTNAGQTKYARALWERIRREFPELRIYRFWERPIGPHPVAMFEVNIFTPAQFGAFIPWLAIWRGPLSALVHPNTDESGQPSGAPLHDLGDDEVTVERRNHTQRAIWMGERVPLDLSVFDAMADRRAAEEAQKEKEKKEASGTNGTNGTSQNGSQSLL